MKVLQVKGGRPLGGIGTFLINMSKNIDSIQFDYLLNCEDTYNEFDCKVDKSKSKIFIAPSLSNLMSYIKYLNNFYKNNAENYDMVHIHSPNIALFNIVLAKKYGVKNIVIHSHNAAYSDNLLKSVRNYFLIVPLRFFDLNYVACGENAAKFLFKNKYKQAKLIFNGVDLEKFEFDQNLRNKMRDENNLTDKFVLGHIGNFTKQKNYDFIVDLAKEMSKSSKECMFVLIGEGVLQDEVKEKVKRLNLDKYFLFTGKVSDVYSYIHLFDVMILPSKFEGFPYVCVEVQAIGIPMLLSDKIDSSVKINDNVKLVELNIDKWVDIINSETFEIQSTKNDKIKQFDSKYQAKSLEEYYYEIYNKDR